MDKIIPNGKRVLIYNYDPKNGNEKKANTVNMGIIMDSELSEPYNFEELPWYERINTDENQGPFFFRLYKVLGDDGKEYYGAYNCGITGDSFFITLEDRINEIKEILKEKNELIQKLELEKQMYTYELNQLGEEIYNIETSSENSQLRLTKKEEK